MKKIFLTIFFIFITLWLYVGVAKDNFAEESYNVFFIKKYPTLKVIFINSTLTEADVPPLNKWKKENLNELKEYCHYRFGITDFTEPSLLECAERPHRPKNWFTEWYVGA